MRFLKQQVFVSNQDYEIPKFPIIIFLNLKVCGCVGVKAMAPNSLIAAESRFFITLLTRRSTMLRGGLKVR